MLTRRCIRAPGDGEDAGRYLAAQCFWLIDGNIFKPNGKGSCLITPSASKFELARGDIHLPYCMTDILGLRDMDKLGVDIQVVFRPCFSFTYRRCTLDVAMARATTVSSPRPAPSPAGACAGRCRPFDRGVGERDQVG
jgi:hypothetical protein